MGRRRWPEILREPRWGALAASFGSLVVVYGSTYSFPVFLVSLTADLAGPRGLVAGAFAVHNLVVGFTATLVDPLMARVGQRPVLAAGGLVLGGGLAFSGSAGSPTELLFWFGVVGGVGAGALGSVAHTVMLSRWFPTARGTATGLALSGMGVGIFLFAPLTAFLIAELGWRQTFVALGIVAAGLLVPTNLLMPVAPTEFRSPVSESRTPGEPPLRTIVRTFRFWCFGAALFFTPISNLMISTHQVAHIIEAGVDPRWAATAFGLVGLLSGIGRAGFGALSDRLGRVRTALASYVVTALGILALMLVSPSAPGWLLYAFILLFGLTFGARGPVIAALAADIYRGRTYGPVLGLITFGNRLGSAIGPWLGGAIYDLTGSYRDAFAVALVAIMLAAVALAGAGWGGARPSGATRVA